MRRGRRRSNHAGEIAKYFISVALIICAIAAGGAIFRYWIGTKPPPRLDKASYCPVDGPRAFTVIVIDTTDPIPQIAQKEAKIRLFDAADALETYGLLEIRILEASGTGRKIFSRCNPGDGSNLDEFTGNPGLARKRWQESFRTPLADAMEASLKPAPSKISPIMATIQNIAVDHFTEHATNGMPKSLIMVSDMIEHTLDYSQYSVDLTFDRFRKSPGFSKYRTDLGGAEVTILLVQRRESQSRSGELVAFWQNWIRDNRGRFREAIKLQGIE